MGPAGAAGAVCSAGLEIFFDRSSPLHLVFVVVLLGSSLACCWVGLRDGFVRRSVRTNAGIWRGRKAQAVGALYLAAGFAGLAGALIFLLRKG